MEIKPIAIIENDFKDKFAIPRQSGIADKITSKIIFEKDYADKNAVRGLEGYSHLWLIWGFSKNIRDKHSLTVRPPRLGGNTRKGVFATRSPFRPNNLGLSSVRLESVEFDEHKHPILLVSGADLMNGTPIYDIKPYIAYSDCHTDAKCGFVDETQFNTLTVKISDKLLSVLDRNKRETLISILQNDPRPAYQNDEKRIYGFKYADYEIKFKVKEDTLTVIDIQNGQ
ncbi:MAG: tRNA (N6-threonylcarbamoyladenosine(37)-N6)-methyltransferase TrmO [Eubacterium sp.]